MGALEGVGRGALTAVVALLTGELVGLVTPVGSGLGEQAPSANSDTAATALRCQDLSGRPSSIAVVQLESGAILHVPIGEPGCATKAMAGPTRRWL